MRVHITKLCTAKHLSYFSVFCQLISFGMDIRGALQCMDGSLKKVLVFSSLNYLSMKCSKIKCQQLSCDMWLEHVEPCKIMFKFDIFMFWELFSNLVNFFPIYNVIQIHWQKTFVKWKLKWHKRWFHCLFVGQILLFST